MPLLFVANEAEPLAGVGLTEVLLIVARGVWLEAEDLDEGACLLAEAEAGLYYLGVVVDEECVGGQQLGYVAEGAMGDVALAIDEQLGLVTLGDGITGYLFGGQGIVVVADMELARGQVATSISAAL